MHTLGGLGRHAVAAVMVCDLAIRTEEDATDSLAGRTNDVDGPTAPDATGSTTGAIAAAVSKGALNGAVDSASGLAATATLAAAIPKTSAAEGVTVSACLG